MSEFFAMGVPTTGDSSGYCLLLPHLWPILVLPLVCFYAILAVWIITKVRGSGADKQSGGVPPSHPPSQQAGFEASDSQLSQPGPGSPGRLGCRFLPVSVPV